MKIYIHGAGILTSCGDLADSWSALFSLKKPSAITLHSHYPPLPLAAIPDLTAEYGSASRLEILLDRLLLQLPKLQKDTALICSTTKGAVDELFTSPLPDKGQPWSMAAEIAGRLQLAGANSCISAACASGTIAIIQGAMKIQRGECTSALILGFDLLSNFVISGFMSLKSLSLGGCKPFDRSRDGLTLGEGAGWLLLSKEIHECDPSDKIISLGGWGTSCDATHITAPCRNGSGLIRTLEQINKQTSMAPGGINAHGTGTFYNDAMELLAFEKVYDKMPSLCSIKGATGHCLGAAGVIEAALSLKCLEEGILPPTVGLTDPEEKAAGAISGTSPLPLSNPSILSCNSGFGGINSGVLFQVEEQ